MKRSLIIAIAFCFILAGNFEISAQKRKALKKSTKPKLVRCYEKGKRVYRKQCRASRIRKPQVVKNPDRQLKTEEFPSSVSSGMGTGNGQGSGTGNGQGNGNGSGYDRGTVVETNEVKPKTKLNAASTSDLKLLLKPKPGYTDDARQNQVQGDVTLSVTFLANGTIGAIKPVKGLPLGLTQQAIDAAKGIRFEPAMKNGAPYTVTKVVVYNFTLY